MAADLKLTGYMHRASLVLLDDQLVFLKHEFTRDRIRRIGLDRVEAVLTWKKNFWVRVLLILVVVGAPSALFLTFAVLGETTFYIPAAVFVGLLLLIELNYLLWRSTTIRVSSAGEDFDFTGIVSPRRVDRLLARLETNIERTQQ